MAKKGKFAVNFFNHWHRHTIYYNKYFLNFAVSQGESNQWTVWTDMNHSSGSSMELKEMLVRDGILKPLQ